MFKKKPVIVGYQGIPGSFSEEAAMYFITNKIKKYKNIELLPLGTTSEVILHLIDGSIDYGVFAYTNTIGGRVRETKEALDEHGNEICVLHQRSMRIHQCLFAKQGIKLEEIKTVVSHIQGLKQTAKFISKNLPYARMSKQIDTALTAKLLSKGILDRYTAVICSKQAGEKYGLSMLAEKIEDSENNYTEFWLTKKM